ncbi:ABC transporter substrate-binding protein [Actinomadura kijaniata]|uniref:Peptide/nickel transport system substrate-binding protein n=1 Tax=Actinomadura namibiensis TaxID=182080 RepID=A0A7W3LLU4_ACTNM|nr:ABC transporter substrate-binding protein [Actinomadura namibiensis]MBA8950511.1 peptide/nickel transport system substrate-binding protein [Actinomadura namibiensis]
MARVARKAAAGLAGLTVLTGVLSACGGGDRSAGAAAGPPRKGGTLRIVGSSDVEHLDTASANSAGSYGLTRTFARTLFGTRASNVFAETVAVQADVAARIPTRENGGISADRRVYTVHLRPGVRWNTEPPRPVTAADFVRGLERLCNPASPSSGKGYYIDTIQGMDAFCRGFARVDAKDAAAIAAYQNEHDIPGLRAADDDTLVFRLRRPVGDFLNLLTLQYTAAAPREYDRHLPDGPEFRQHTLSNGPYRIAEYRPGRSYLLTHNPVWRPETDPLRSRHAARIQITLGQDSPETVQQQIERGDADLSWDQPVPTAALPRVRRDRRFAIRELPSNNPYLVFNTRSPHNGGALAKPEVRRALAHAVDRSALVKIVGGPDVAQPLHTVIPPGTTGYAPSDRYATPGAVGDPGRCRELLGRTGHRDLTLRFPYRTNSVHRLIAQSIAANLEACGVRARLTADSGGNFYARTISTPEQARAGAWDIAAPGWIPDWYGNNGRTLIAPLFDGRDWDSGSTNYGGYDDFVVNGLIDAALTAPDERHAAGLWQQADRKITQDAAIVPLLNRSATLFTSERVRNARFLPTAAGYDYTHIWLSS